MAEVLVSRFAIAGSEFVGELLCADSVDRDCEAVIRDGCIAGLDAP